MVSFAYCYRLCRYCCLVDYITTIISHGNRNYRYFLCSRYIITYLWILVTICIPAWWASRWCILLQLWITKVLALYLDISCIFANRQLPLPNWLSPTIFQINSHAYTAGHLKHIEQNGIGSWKRIKWWFTVFISTTLQSNEADKWKALALEVA